jgi:hypothetical protein
LIDVALVLDRRGQRLRRLMCRPRIARGRISGRLLWARFR